MTSSSLLSCQKELAPPLSSVGAREALIEYTSNSQCWQVSFSSDGELLAACYGAPDCCARIFELENFTLVAALKDLHSRTVRSCSFAPVAMNYTLATASFDGTIGVWEKGKDDQWDCIAQLEGHESECKCVEWNAAATLLATCGRDKTVWLWDCSLQGNIGGGDGDFECLAVLNGHEGDVKSVVFAPSRGQFGDGDEICLSGSYDNTIRIWAEDAGDWYCALVLTESHTIWSLALAPGATRLISGSADASVGIYKLYTAQERKLVPGEQIQQGSSTSNQGTWKCVGRLSQAHQSEVMSVSYAPAKAGHGRFASCGDTLQIYREVLESTSEHPLFALEASSERMNLNAVRWHPRDGSMLATAGDDGKVRIWAYGKTVAPSSSKN